MNDSEKVIKGLECCKDIHTVPPGYAQGCIDCPYSNTPADGANGMACIRKLFDDAIDILKAEEKQSEHRHKGNNEDWSGAQGNDIERITEQAKRSEWGIYG